MKNKILILYLHPDALEIGRFSKENIRAICNQSEGIFFKNACTIALFKYEEKDFGFVLTMENDRNKGVKWPILKEVLLQYIQGIYDISFVIQHKENNGEGLELPFDEFDFDYGGLDGDDLFCQKIEDLIKSFGEGNSESCKRTMEEFKKSKDLLDVEFEKIPTLDAQCTQNDINQKFDVREAESSEGIKWYELDKILEGLGSCNDEVTIVMSPKISTDMPQDKTGYIKHLNSRKCFVLVEEKTKSESTEALKKILNSFNVKELYMAIHGISTDIDFDVIKNYVKTNPDKKVCYCNFQRTGRYEHIRKPFENIINKIEVEENYQKLKKAIEQSYKGGRMVEVINKIISLFYPLSIDLIGLAEVPDEMKIEYFDDMLISIKNRYEDHLTYFRQKLVNLRYFVSGTLEESTIDSLNPNIEIFKDFNLKSLPAFNINKRKAEELSGLRDEKSPIIGFLKLLDEALEEAKKEERIKIIRIVVNYFKELYWEVSGRRINNYHDWFILVVNTLIDIKKREIDDKH